MEHQVQSTLKGLKNARDNSLLADNGGSPSGGQAVAQEWSTNPHTGRKGQPREQPDNQTRQGCQLPTSGPYRRVGNQ